jgi:protease-4
MSEPHVSPPAPESQPRPAAPPAPPPPVSVKPAAPARFSFLGVALTFSFLFNCLAVVVLAIVCFGVIAFKGAFDTDSLANAPLNETVVSGNSSTKDKVAVIHIEGVIMEGTLQYAHKQIEQAGEDDSVKAVVVRVNSPGGSITASDDLYHRLVELRDGAPEKKDPSKKNAKKPLVVSMGSLAASGGYYISAPAQTIVAERTTMTGSIGVYAAFPNVYGLMKDHGVSMITIKQGQIKDSGSPFKPMTPEEERVWQDMVNHAYLQFVEVVEDGRNSRLKYKLLDEFDVEPTKGQDKLAHPPAKGTYKRYLADGGVWTADKALEFGLIDQIGYLEDAVKVAKQAAGGGDLKTIQYEKPKSLTEMLLGAKTKPTNTGLLDPGQVKNGFMPRLWYLMPGSEAAGILAGMDAPPN